MENMLKFEIPQLYNHFERAEILCNLEALAKSALYISGYTHSGFDEPQVFKLPAEFDDPESVYEKSYDELIEIVGGYNFIISENELPEQPIKLVVDEEKTNQIKNGSHYPIYKVVLCDGLA